MFSPITTTDGQVSGVDSLSPAASSVVNWEVDDAGINLPRPGLVEYTVAGGLSDAIATGVHRWQSRMIFTDDDNQLWTVSDAVPMHSQLLSDGTSTTVLEGTRRPVFAIGDTNVYVTNGRRITYWGPEFGLAQQLTSSPDCTHIAVLGQRLVANDISSTSIVRYSDIGEGAWGTWPAANTLSPDARPDTVVGLADNSNELYIWGTETLQVYVVGSDPTLPYDLVSSINVGLGAPYCFVRLDESFVFLDDKRRIGVCDGRSFTDIGKAIQRDLRGLSTVSDGWAYREEIGQFSRLVFRFPTDMRTFVYDVDGKRWSERHYYDAPFQTDWKVGASAFWSSRNYQLACLTDGGLARLDPDTRQDLGGPLVCERTTGWHDHGSAKRKRSNMVRVVLRRGTAAVGATPGALEVRVQNDDGAWSAWEQISVGNDNDPEQVRDVRLGGVFRRRRYGFRFSNTEQMSLVAAYDDVTELAS